MDQSGQALRLLFSLLDERRRLGTLGDAEGLGEVEAQVADAVDKVARGSRRPMRTSIGGPPPRAVAVAMAQALFSAPHVSRTLAVEATISDHHGFVPSASLADALGIPLWELEEIREDVDRRVALFLKQTRALNWLWFRFDNPSIHPRPLFNTLFPGREGAVPKRFTRRGGRLYIVLSQPAPPPREALYLRWLPALATCTAHPDAYFSPKYIDASVCRGIERGIGATSEEVEHLLKNMVCAIPEGDEEPFMVQDRWRNEGWAELTGLGTADPSPAWLSWPMPASGIDTEGWIRLTSDGIVLKGVRRAFDRHALLRMTALSHGLYANMCAQLLQGEAIDRARQGMVFDLGPYTQRALQPLLDWTALPESHASLAKRLGVSVSSAAGALDKVREIWLASSTTSWGGVPSEANRHSVQSILATHLAVAQASLHHVYRLPADPRGPHHRVLAMFFAHYMQAAPVGRLWRAEDGVLPPPEDVVGEWFWGTWQRVLDSLDVDNTAWTHS